MAVCLGPQLSKLAARISEPFVKCLQRLDMLEIAQHAKPRGVR